MLDKPYLSYYMSQGIIPVRQDTRDLGIHMSRRRALYRHLGVQPLTLRGRRILEFGPGTGDNALYIASCAPERCVLVDMNPASIRAIEEKLEQDLLSRQTFECRTSDILEYRDAERYDIVLCEGVVPLQEQPERFLSHVASFAGQDGIVVITTMSAASVLAEICRRLIKPVFRARTADPAELLHSLVAFFKPDLLSLPGMSRLHEDWVLDNILHPWPRRCTFTVPEAIETLDGGFDWLGTSPAVFQDWRWYKSIPRDEKTWNDIGREQYRRWGAYLIDYRVTPGAEGGISRDLDAACEAALALQHGMWCGDSLDDLPRFLEALAEIRDMLAGPLPLTAASIGDYQKGMEALAGGADPGGADFGSFRSWFGRGQQYVSFVRSAA